MKRRNRMLLREFVDSAVALNGVVFEATQGSVENVKPLGPVIERFMEALAQVMQDSTGALSEAVEPYRQDIKDTPDGFYRDRKAHQSPSKN